MEEIWKDVKDYEGYYQVSNFGKLRSLDRNVKYGMTNRIMLFKGKLIKGGDNGVGYLQASLLKGGRRSFLLHRLVAMAFIPNPGNLPEINHIDGNKYNCAVANLEWVNHSANMRHSADKLGNYDNHPNKLMVGALNWNSKSVDQFDLRGNFIRSYGSTTEAFRETMIDCSSIQKVCLGKRSRAGGFVWKYSV